MHPICSWLGTWLISLPGACLDGIALHFLLTSQNTNYADLLCLYLTRSNSIADVRKERERQHTQLPKRLREDTTLNQSFNRLINGALAYSTNEKYARPWLRFREWLAQYDITEPLTIDAQTVAFYVVHLITSADLRGIGDALVLTALASIAHHFSLAGITSPTSSPHLT